MRLDVFEYILCTYDDNDDPGIPVNAYNMLHRLFRVYMYVVGINRHGFT